MAAHTISIPHNLFGEETVLWERQSKSSSLKTWLILTSKPAAPLRFIQSFHLGPPTKKTKLANTPPKITTAT